MTEAELREENAQLREKVAQLEKQLKEVRRRAAVWKQTSERHWPEMVWPYSK